MPQKSGCILVPDGRFFNSSHLDTPAANLQNYSMSERLSIDPRSAEQEPGPAGAGSQPDSPEAREVPKDELAEARQEYAESSHLLKSEVKFGGKQGKEARAAMEEAAKQAPLDLSLLKSENPEDQARAGETREKFIASLKERGLNDAQAQFVYLAEVKKLEYEDKKKDLLRQNLAAKEQKAKASIESRSGLKEGDWTDEEKNALQVEIASAKAELFKTYVVQERELLQRVEAETWPPQEKKLWRKGVEWYLRQNRYARIAGTTALMTGAFWALSGTTLLGAASYGSYRFGRALLSTTAGQAAAKATGALSQKILEKRRGERLGKEEKPSITDLSVDNLSELEKQWAKEMEAKAKDKRTELYIKAAAAILVGGGTAYGLGSVGELWGGGPSKEAVTETEAPEKAEMPLLQVEPAPLESRPLQVPITEAPRITSNPAAVAEASPIVPPPPPPPEAGAVGEPQPGEPTMPPLKSRPLSPEMVEQAMKAELPRVQGSMAVAELPPEQVEEQINRLEELATIKKGEGVWHAVYRQLEARLPGDAELQQKLGLSSEDMNDAAKVKAALNRETGRLLVEQNYIRPDGSEVRIAKEGVKVRLAEDGVITIEDRESVTYEWKPPAEPEGAPTAEAAEAEVEAAAEPQASAPPAAGMPAEVRVEEIPSAAEAAGQAPQEIAQAVRQEITSRPFIEGLRKMEDLARQVKENPDVPYLKSYLEIFEQEQLNIQKDLASSAMANPNYSLLDQERILGGVAGAAARHPEEADYFKELLRTLQEHPGHRQALENYEHTWRGSGLSENEFDKVRGMKAEEFLKNYAPQRSPLSFLPEERGLTLEELAHRRELARILNGLRQGAPNLERLGNLSVENLLKGFRIEYVSR